METQQAGMDPSQGAETLPPEDDLMDDQQEGGSSSKGDGEWRRTFEARMDLLSQGLTQLNQSLAALGRPQVTQEQLMQEFDDDEPLTPSKVSKIVNSAIGTAVSQSNALNERKSWDTKAREEFPINDPQFQAEFNRQWESFRDAGGNLNHPKAVYKICTDVSRVLGASVQKPKRTAEPTAEAPTPGGGQPSQRRGAGGKIADDDSRVRFFKLRNSDPEKIKAFKERLAAKDSKSASRRRG